MGGPKIQEMRTSRRACQLRSKSPADPEARKWHFRLAVDTVSDALQRFVGGVDLKRRVVGQHVQELLHQCLWVGTGAYVALATADCVMITVPKPSAPLLPVQVIPVRGWIGTRGRGS